MTGILDKSGRIIIPKTIRDSFGLQSSAEFEIRETDWGWPVIHYVDNESRPFDPSALIQKGREERIRHILNNNDAG